MASRTRRLECKSDIGFFTRAELIIKTLRVFIVPAAAVEVNCKARVDQAAGVFEQEGRSVGVPTGFLIGGKGHDDGALGNVVLTLEPDERVDEGGVAILHV